MKPLYPLVRIALFAGVVVECSSCGEGAAPPPAKPPACITPSDPNSCLPLFAPDFAEIFQRTLKTTCASSGVSCHGENGRQGGLVFVDAAASYDALIGLTGGKAYVVPNDSACSELMVRLDFVGQEWSMPVGDPLDERARCSIRRWIANGAPRSMEGGR